MPEGINPDRACDLCRERRVKCDKRKPGCERCEKLGKSCPGYAKKRKFVDEGVNLRRKFQHAKITEHEGDRPSEYRRHTDQASIGVRSPARRSDHQQSVAETSRQEGWRKVLPLSLQEPAKSTAPGSYGLPPGETIPISANIFADPEASKEIPTTVTDSVDESIFDPAWFDLEPSKYYSEAGNSCGFLPTTPSIVDEVDRPDDLPMDGTLDNDMAMHNDLELWASQSQLHTSQLISDQREHEMAYLTRHFCENVGPWMDLYNAEHQFAQLVPLKALRDVLLKNAIAAVAAKQLGCTKGDKPFTIAQSQLPATMEVINDNVEWFYKAANYYDKAIMYSRVYLQALSGSLSKPPSPAVSTSLNEADSDDLLLAVSMFSLYEYLDNAATGWIQHLNGLKTILNVLTPPSMRSVEMDAITLGRRASFWNFAQADYQAAYINRTATLLNTEDLSMWADAGLQINASGDLYSKPEAVVEDQGAQSGTNELVARTLLWILLRIMNWMFRDQREPTEPVTTWHELSLMLDSWEAARPKSFQPCARLRHPVSHSCSINELFFSIPLCAATVQLYHFARILLLLHKPASEENDQRQADLLDHAYTIIGIALARPAPAVRVEMLLPLCVAGSCLKGDDERGVVIDLLVAIQKDTGCGVESQIHSLTQSWGWKAKKQVADGQPQGMRQETGLANYAS